MSEEEQEKLYDIVVLGSTGYTGKFVAEELYRVQCEVRRSLRWAAAGRSAEKVRSCLEGESERYGSHARPSMHMECLRFKVVEILYVEALGLLQ